MNACAEQAFHACSKGLKLCTEYCPKCDAPVLDYAGHMLSFCDNCDYDWIVGKVCNPLADYVKADDELIADYDRICMRVG